MSYHTLGALGACPPCSIAFGPECEPCPPRATQPECRGCRTSEARSAIPLGLSLAMTTVGIVVVAATVAAVVFAPGRA